MFKKKENMEGKWQKAVPFQKIPAKKFKLNLEYEQISASYSSLKMWSFPLLM